MATPPAPPPPRGGVARGAEPELPGRFLLRLSQRIVFFIGGGGGGFLPPPPPPPFRRDELRARERGRDFGRLLLLLLLLTIFNDL